MTLFPGYYKAFFRVLLVVALLTMLALGGLAITCLNRTTSNTAPVRIYLPPSDIELTARDTLLANGLVDDGPVFNLIALKLNAGWREGSYVVEPNTPVHRLIKRITRGQQDPIRLTLGKFRLPGDLNAYLDTKLMRSGFNVPLDSFHLIRPDTYEVYWTITPDQFMQRMGKEYDRFWSRRDTTACGLSRREAVILASIVEEETNHNPEKPLIASVYLNRLRLGMPLQADPTVKYAVGDFTLRRILHMHLQAASPYNTYLHTGLPPAPICLPSAASVDAVLAAKDTPYLYFCASPDMDGTHRFAATLTEHNRNAAAFHRALNARGIYGN